MQVPDTSLESVTFHDAAVWKQLTHQHFTRPQLERTCTWVPRGHRNARTRTSWMARARRWCRNTCRGRRFARIKPREAINAAVECQKVKQAQLDLGTAAVTTLECRECLQQFSHLPARATQSRSVYGIAIVGQIDDGDFWPMLAVYIVFSSDLFPSCPVVGVVKNVPCHLSLSSTCTFSHVSSPATFDSHLCLW